MKVIIASKNIVKIEAARLAFARMFPGQSFLLKGVSVLSGVSDQPMTDAEAYQGALNRVQAARTLEPDADYWIAFEGGVETKDLGTEEFTWAAVEDVDNRFGSGRSASFFLPPEIARHISEGKSLGEADSLVFGRSGASEAEGAIGRLTGDVMTRTSYITDAAVLALIPFKNPELYPQ